MANHTSPREIAQHDGCDHAFTDRPDRHRWFGNMENLQMPHVSTYGSPFPIPRWDGGPPVKIKFAQTLKLQPRPADMVLVPQTGFLG